MKLRSCVASTLSVISGITVLGFCATVQARTFSSSSSGIWGVPFSERVNTNPSYSVEESAQGNIFSWGNQSIFGTGPNFLTFVGSQVSNVAIGSSFELGKVEYFNGSVLYGTAVDSIPFNLGLSLQDNNQVLPQTSLFPGEDTYQAFTDLDFSIRFDIENTPNIFLDPDQNADSVVITQETTNFNFRLDDKEYKIEFLGFSQGNSGTISNKITARENTTVTASLYAKITEEPEIKRIPESGSLLGIFLCWIYLFYRSSQQLSQFKN
ncbi:MAG: choice-of-anchor K domain-containing protein [Nostocaceae cyanobacterium]|nr:choice-of-anchor K domain-containing protein [Nostocaceae cyanobacterium]